MAIPEKVKKAADRVRAAIYGGEVQESIAIGLEAAGEVADEANGRSKETDVRQSKVETDFKTLQQEYTENGNGAQTSAEITLARDGEPVLADRLARDFGNVNAQLAQTADKEINIADYQKLVVGGLWDDAIEQALIDANENGKLVFVKSKKFNYKISKPIVTKFPNQVITGNGFVKIDATLLNGEYDAVILKHDGCLIEKIHIIQKELTNSPQNNSDSPAGIRLVGYGAQAKECRNTYGLHGFLIQSDLAKVDNCISKRTREKGILSDDANCIDIKNNTIEESGWDGTKVSNGSGSGIQITGLIQGMSNINVENNISKNNAGNGIQMTLLGGSAVNHNIIYKGNKCLNNMAYGASLKITNNPTFTPFDRLLMITIDGNTFADNWICGLHVDFAKNISFANNTYYRNGRDILSSSSYYGDGLRLNGCEFVTLANEKFIKNIRGLNLFSTNHVKAFGIHTFNNVVGGIALSTPSEKGSFYGLVSNKIRDIYLNGCISGNYNYPDDDPLAINELQRNTQQRFVFVSGKDSVYDDVKGIVIDNCTSLNASLAHIDAPSGGYIIKNSQLGDKLENEVTHLMIVQRDLTLTGSQTISNLKNRPRSIICSSTVNASKKISDGYWTEEIQLARYSYGEGLYSTTGSLVRITENNTDVTNGKITNVSDNSFDIEWSKSGLGSTGTVQMILKIQY